jgi:hypothetical protein
MTGRRRIGPPPWPAAGIALYALGLLAVLAVSLALGGEDDEPALWALSAVPVASMPAASLVVRRHRARRSSIAPR